MQNESQDQNYNVMIVPEFKLKQTENAVQVFIRVPYIKVSSCEFYIESNTFKFYLKPYLLSLTFQQALKEVEEPAKAVYYNDKYLLEVHLQKANQGQEFKDLELLAGLLNNKKNPKRNRVVVEVVGQEAGNVVIEVEESKVCHYNYGFSMNYSNVMDNLDEETAQLFEFDPKTIPLPERHQLSNQILIRQFDYDSYLFDKYQNEEEILSILADKEYRNHIENRVKQLEEKTINSVEFKLKMSGKQLLVSKETGVNAIREVVSIVFSYVYELICMRGEIGAESARTINKTSLVLSCSTYYWETSTSVIIADCFKRCITYSLYKSLKICHLVLKWLQKVTDLKYLIVILLEVKELFDHNEPRYLLNQLFINDYLIYLYSLGVFPKQFEQLIKEVSKVAVNEDDLGLGIKEYQQMENQEKEDSETENDPKFSQEEELIKKFQKFDTLD